MNSFFISSVAILGPTFSHSVLNTFVMAFFLSSFEFVTSSAIISIKDSPLEISS